LLDRAGSKTLICVGAGKILKRFCETFRPLSFFENIDMIADNDAEKHGTEIEFDGCRKTVRTFEDCITAAKTEPIVLISTKLEFATEIVSQIEEIPCLDEMECHCGDFVLSQPPPYAFPKPESGKRDCRIPKTIHYCWFGGKEIPDNDKRCIDSWHKFCPDYEIVRWDESNYDYRKNRYMAEAYSARKWGFVPDYARLDIVYDHGGIYLDTDVEILQNPDALLRNEAFCGFESYAYIAFGLGFGAVKGFPLIKEMRDFYEDKSFVKEDGSLDLTPSPIFQTEALSEHGLLRNNTPQTVEGMTVYPSDVLCPYQGFKEFVTHNTFTIHHFNASWFTEGLMNDKRETQKRLHALVKRLER
jgi:hypothetical protein